MWAYIAGEVDKAEIQIPVRELSNSFELFNDTHMS